MHSEEPVAGKLHGGFCGGRRGKPLRLPDMVWQAWLKNISGKIPFAVIYSFSLADGAIA
jgi:hypothetical protein